MLADSERRFVSNNGRVARSDRPARGLLVALPLGIFLAVTAVGVSAERSQESTGPAVVRLTDVQQSLHHVEVSAGGMGDLEIANLRLFGTSTQSRAIGTGVLTCTFVSKTQRTCNGSYLLPRGMIQTAGVLNTRLLYTAAITGGTGLYDNARGTLTVTAKGLKPRRELLLFRLSG
jgi:hypothetical protein